MPPHLEEVCGVWVYGQSGVGKTHWAMEKYPNAYLKQLDAKWTGYAGQDNVIVDDMDPFHKNLGKCFKDWGDKFVFAADAKWGGGNYRPKAVVVTSQYHPQEIWSDYETYSAIKRRYKIFKKELGLDPVLEQ